MASLSLQGLRKEFDSGQIVAVSGLDLDIDDGEFVTVVGPSGCGKTTTLRMIAGLETPTAGAIRIGGDVVTQQSARERDVAMVFQNYALYPHKTVSQNMAFGLRMSTDMSREDRTDRVYETAEMMGIEELLEQKPDELSGGQKQRVALGRAIVREPSVFLFDEPLSNLDAKLRTSMRAEIQRLQNELGITAVYVTHDQEEAMTMGDRIVVLRAGELQQVGSPKQVYEHPANRFVAGFIGSPSMNFVDVTLDQGGVVRNDGGFEYQLSSDYVEGLDLAPGTGLVAGIRPEHVIPAEDGEGIATRVEVVEPVGSDNYLYLDVGDEEDTATGEAGEEFIARVDADVDPEPGDTAIVEFEERKLRLFDAETGQALATSEETREALEAQP